MTVVNYDQLPDGVYSSEYREQKDKMTTTYTGSKLTYNGTDYEEDGSTIKRINETRYDYYTRNHKMVAFTLTVGDALLCRRGGSSYSGPYITPLLTAPDAKSATDYSGGIYGLTFKSSASFPASWGGAGGWQDHRQELLYRRGGQHRGIPEGGVSADAGGGQAP